ncbi:MAG: ABC transporter ATP-binding protein [Geminicoccaceae bacterium]|nr:MAG: ABC transporter ATP-binding protein [Geminicoccaceae bacterium]
MSVSRPLLQVRDLHVAFRADEGVVEAVRGVSFDVERGQTLAVVGESGSGKTVLSQAILGILPANARIERGQILFDDPELQPEPVDLAAYDQNHPMRRRIRGGRISIIFQEPMSSLSPVHTIGEQIAEALRLHVAVTRSEERSRVVEMLDHVGFPKPKEAYDFYPFELSGGLRQRAMIAMALICEPALLIADEPTTALDVTIQAQILDLMRRLQAEYRMAILFITHDLGVVANLADDIVVMYRGRVMEAGSADELLRAPEHPYLRGLMRAVPRIDMDRAARLQPLREIPVTGGELRALIGAGERHAAEGPLLEIDRLAKSYGTRKGGWLGKPERVKAMVDVGFTIARGESFAVVGESGSGKTTLAKAIMRAIDVDQGRITFHDPAQGPIDVLGLDGERLARFRTKVQYVFQDPFASLNPRMSVADIIAEPLVIHGIGTAESRSQRVRALMRAVGLDLRFLRRYPHSFSGGQRQRIGIARALALGPELLICDEPVSALDVSVQAQVLNLLRDLQRELGLTYLFIAHNLAVVRYLCDRVAVMCKGRIVELAPTVELFTHPRHPYTRALLAAVPEPDPDQRLDLTLLRDGAMSTPEAWPAPFTLTPRNDGAMVEVAPGHWLRQSARIGGMDVAAS